MRLQFLCLTVFLISTSSYKVCGNYCGPNYCNGQFIPESECDESVKPENWKWFGMSCADKCCQRHDRCCRGDHDTTPCNTEIVHCLSNCNHASLTCTYSGIPIPASVIEVAMDIVEDWCCGHPCNTTEDIGNKSLMQPYIVPRYFRSK